MNDEMTWRAARTDIWRYCTEEHCREMLLSLRLLGENDWPEEKVMSCLYALSNHGEQHYRRISIPKRDGTIRTLLAPDPLLKYVQRNILHHVLEGLSVADSAMAYRRWPGTVRNAAMHAGKPLVMKLDIRNFFGNITFSMVLRHAFPVSCFPPAVGTLLTALCCYGEYLPQGAPTSPAISNLVMKPFDEAMITWCGERGISYSRYCDDMTFSGEFDTQEVRRKAESLLCPMGFELNRKKTRILSRGTRQTVTGLVVNDRVQVPSGYRRELRQEIYYCRRFGVEEHLRHCGKAGMFRLPGGEIDRRRYLRVLLGKVQYVRLTRAEDPWFKEAERWIKAEMQKWSA